MITEIKFIVPGNPQGKSRPRFTKNGHTYTPQKTRDYENLIEKCCIKELNKIGCDKFSGALLIDIKAFFSIPKSTTKAEREYMQNGYIFPLKKPDVDNIAKVVLDALNGIAYDDDKQVQQVTCGKYYVSNQVGEPCLYVRIQVLKGIC